MELYLLYSIIPMSNYFYLPNPKVQSLIPLPILRLSVWILVGLVIKFTKNA